MAWTSPKTWITGDDLIATVLNTHIRDNLNYLKDVSVDSALLGGDTAVASSSFVDVSGSWSVTIVPRSTSLILGVNLMVMQTNPNTNFAVTFEQDDGVTQTNLGGTEGIATFVVDTSNAPSQTGTASGTYLVTGLTAGTSYTFTVRAKGSSASSFTVQAESFAWGMDLP